MEGLQRNKHHYILILCGGTGPRLWPLSRASHPKQFLEIFNNESLLLSTIKRAKKIVPKSHVFLVSNARYLEAIKEFTGSSIDHENIISEPIKKNTFMAILYASSIIKSIDPDAIITTLPSDHYIKKLLSFKKDIIKSAKVAKDTKSLVAIGIKPTSPNPAFGYIVPEQKPNREYSKVTKFVEKPDVSSAAKLIKSKAYWNAGMYSFSLSLLEEETAKLQKDYFSLYKKLENDINNPKVVEKVYKLSPSLPIDTAISENTNRLVAIKAKFDWNDVGEWRSIYEQLSKTKQGLKKLKPKTILVEQNSKNCLVSGVDKKIIGLVGVDNLAIIDTPDALLVCNLDQSFNVRDLVGEIVKSKSTENYFLTNNENKK